MVSQGSIAPHSLEQLGTLDQGVVMFRRQLRQGIRDVKEGREPRGLIRSSDVQPTYSSDRIIPAASMGGDPADPDALLAYTQGLAQQYLKAPPLQQGKVPPPPPLPSHAFAPAGTRTGAVRAAAGVTAFARIKRRIRCDDDHAGTVTGIRD